MLYPRVSVDEALELQDIESGVESAGDQPNVPSEGFLA